MGTPSHPQHPPSPASQAARNSAGSEHPEPGSPVFPRKFRYRGSALPRHPSNSFPDPGTPSHPTQVWLSPKHTSHWSMFPWSDPHDAQSSKMGPPSGTDTPPAHAAHVALSPKHTPHASRGLVRFSKTYVSA